MAERTLPSEAVTSPGQRIILALDFADIAISVYRFIPLAKELRGLQVSERLPGRLDAFNVAAHALKKGVHGLYFDFRNAHDAALISERVHKTTTACRRLEFLSIDASIGFEAMAAAQNNIVEHPKSPFNTKLVAFTVPPSRSESDCREAMAGSPSEVVCRLGGIAARAGMAAITASGHEMRDLAASSEPGVSDLLRIATGIHLPGGKPSEGVYRSMEPAQAIDAGADLLVIGRAVTQAPDPEHALDRILTQIA